MAIKDWPDEKILELYGSIVQSVDTERALSQMTNEQIGELLFLYVWAEMEVFSPQADLVQQAYRRLGFTSDTE